MNIRLITHQGIPHTVKVSKDGLVKNLKNEIKKLLGIHFDEQRLLFNNNSMDDDNKNLLAYGLTDNSEVKLIILFKKESFEIEIELQNGKKFKVGVRSNDTLSDVRKKIREPSQLSPMEQILIYQGAVLEGNNTISSYGVEDRSVIHVLHKVLPGINIDVKTLDGKSERFNIGREDSISAVKKKIHEVFGIEPDMQRLIFNGNMLLFDGKVIDCGIEEDSVIKVLSRPRGGIKVTCKILNGDIVNGNIVNVVVMKDDKVITLKQKIKEYSGMAPEEQKLVFNSIVLIDDDQTVEKCGIVDGSTIYVVTLLRQEIDITVKTMDGKMVCIPMSRRDKISQMKIKIKELLGVSPDDQKLVYLGGILTDDNTVDDLNFKESNVINLICRLRG